MAVRKDTGHLPRRLEMKACSNVVAALVAGAWLGTGGSIARAAPCLIVTLTGTHGGPRI